MTNKRLSGILLHITSLPSKYGVGTLGSAAYQFIDWLHQAKMSVWQVLPLVPTNYGDSPYQSVSSTALNYYLIDLDILKNKGLLKEEDYVHESFSYDERHTNYELLFYKKIATLKKAFESFDVNEVAFKNFVKKKEYHDFSVFMVLKALHLHRPWFLWQEPYKTYSKDIEAYVIEHFNKDYLFWQWTQYEFLLEWNALRAYAKTKQIQIMGDMPLYVAYDSVEVWKHPELFILTESKGLKLVAGCPPDAFSEDGQLWGNPVYNWDYMKQENYAWWNERINRAFELYDILRIDHFRGFDRFYAIPAEDINAKNGTWLDGPKFDLFKDKTDYQIVAEDLGIIDDGVKDLMKQTGYPGMRVLSFAFDGNPDNDHKPSNYKTNCLVYTGTHDNMPFYQYVEDLDLNALEALKLELKEECLALGVACADTSYQEITKTVVELAFASVAFMCIIPMQDYMGLDNSCRMNQPSTVGTNWRWRLTKEDLTEELKEEILSVTRRYGR